MNAVRGHQACSKCNQPVDDAAFKQCEACKQRGRAKKEGVAQPQSTGPRNKMCMRPTCRAPDGPGTAPRRTRNNGDLDKWCELCYRTHLQRSRTDVDATRMHAELAARKRQWQRNQHTDERVWVWLNQKNHRPPASSSDANEWTQLVRDMFECPELTVWDDGSSSSVATLYCWNELTHVMSWGRKRRGISFAVELPQQPHFLLHIQLEYLPEPDMWLAHYGYFVDCHRHVTLMRRPATTAPVSVCALPWMQFVSQCDEVPVVSHERLQQIHQQYLTVDPLGPVTSFPSQSAGDVPRKVREFASDFLNSLMKAWCLAPPLFAELEDSQPAKCAPYALNRRLTGLHAAAADEPAIGDDECRALLLDQSTLAHWGLTVVVTENRGHSLSTRWQLRLFDTSNFLHALGRAKMDLETRLKWVAIGNICIASVRILAEWQKSYGCVQFLWRAAVMQMARDLLHSSSNSTWFHAEPSWVVQPPEEAPVLNVASNTEAEKKGGVLDNKPVDHQNGNPTTHWQSPSSPQSDVSHTMLQSSGFAELLDVNDNDGNTSLLRMPAEWQDICSVLNLHDPCSDKPFLLPAPANSNPQYVKLADAVTQRLEHLRWDVDPLSYPALRSSSASKVLCARLCLLWFCEYRRCLDGDSGWHHLPKYFRTKPADALPSTMFDTFDVAAHAVATATTATTTTTPLLIATTDEAVATPPKRSAQQFCQIVNSSDTHGATMDDANANAAAAAAVAATAIQEPDLLNCDSSPLLQQRYYERQGVKRRRLDAADDDDMNAAAGCASSAAGPIRTIQDLEAQLEWWHKQQPDAIEAMCRRVWSNGPSANSANSARNVRSCRDCKTALPADCEATQARCVSCRKRYAERTQQKRSQQKMSAANGRRALPYQTVTMTASLPAQAQAQTQTQTQAQHALNELVAQFDAASLWTMLMTAWQTHLRRSESAAESSSGSDNHILDQWCNVHAPVAATDASLETEMRHALSAAWRQTHPAAPTAPTAQVARTAGLTPTLPARSPSPLPPPPAPVTAPMSLSAPPPLPPLPAPVTAPMSLSAPPAPAPARLASAAQTNERDLQWHKRCGKQDTLNIVHALYAAAMS